MRTTQIGLSAEFPYCIRDNEVYCSTLCKNGNFERSPLDENVKAFGSLKFTQEYIKRKHINGHALIPYKEWENQDD